MQALHTPATRLRLSTRAVLLAVAVLLASLGVPALAGAETPSPAAENVVPDRILVKWASGTPERAKAEGRAAAGAQKIKEIEQLGVDVLRVPAHAAERALQGLQRNPHVVYAEQDLAVELDGVTPDDPEYARQWGVVKTRTDQAWARTTGTSTTVIAILDTGVAPVADIANKLVPGRNIVAGNSDTTDEHGHGTMSATVAGAEANNSLATAGYCWHCRIMPVKVMESTGTMSDLASGITWATDQGAHVISMSLSGASGNSTILNAVRYAASRNVVLVAAAGNQGGSSPRYPAAYDEVIAVAGTDVNDELYSWSNYGSWVSVSAPGVNRTMSHTGSTVNYGGTSSATPAAAGILGLARSHGATASEARTALERSATTLPFVRHGRIDSEAMLASIGAAPQPVPEPSPPPEPEPSPTTSPAPEPEPSPDTDGPAKKCHPKRGC